MKESIDRLDTQSKQYRDLVAKNANPELTSGEREVNERAMESTILLMQSTFMDRMKAVGYSDIKKLPAKSARQLTFIGTIAGVTSHFTLIMAPEKAGFPRMLEIMVQPFSGETFTEGSDKRLSCEVGAAQMADVVGDAAKDKSGLAPFSIPLRWADSTNGKISLTFAGKEKPDVWQELEDLLIKRYPGDALKIQSARAALAEKHPDMKYQPAKIAAGEVIIPPPPTFE